MTSRSHAKLRVPAIALIMAVAALAGSAHAEAGCMPAALAAKLNQIRAKFGPVQVISTHRPGARIAGSGRMSYHASCRAVDFHPPRGKYREVVAWLKANHGGGVGTYSCGLSHIHIDTGPRVRFHKCQGGGRYASRSAKKRYATRGGRSGKTYVNRPHRTTGRYASAR